jgi:hypothetical protein
VTVRRRYEENLRKLPPVAVPDWELLRRLGELLGPYGEVTFQGEDSRGQYSATDMDAFRAEMEERVEQPTTVTVLAKGTNATWINVYMTVPKGIWGTGGVIESENEATVAHVAKRVRENLRAAFSLSEEGSRRSIAASFRREPPPRPRVLVQGRNAAVGTLARHGGRDRRVDPARGEVLLMLFYGIADYTVNEILVWYVTREEAEDALARVLIDEPDWEPTVGVETVELKISSN